MLLVQLFDAFKPDPYHKEHEDKQKIIKILYFVNFVVR